MAETETGQLTQLLHRLREPDAAASQELIGRVVTDLRRLAARFMRQEQAGHTLQPTALVNEVYLRMFEGQAIEWKDRAHFYAVAACQMRRVLVDHARKKRAGKRGGGAVHMELAEYDAPEGFGASLERVNDALEALEKLDARAAKVVELKFFGGLENKEIAEVLQASSAQVRRDWTFAKAFLNQQLSQ